MNQSFDRSSISTLDKTSLNLQAFNHLILQHQDEAYTLAVDLLGDEILAEEVLEKALAQAFGSLKRLPSDFRMEILRQVLQACLRSRRGISGPKPLARFMAGLSLEEKLVLVLVDCLALDYADAAILLGQTPLKLSKSLAKARYKINIATLSFGNR